MLLTIITNVPVLLVFGPNSCWTFSSFLLASLLYLRTNSRLRLAADQCTISTPMNKSDAHERKGGKQRGELLIAVHPHKPNGNHGYKTKRAVRNVPALGVWVFLSILLFYKSGHLCDFSSLQFESAFIGTAAQ